ncbi:MAG: DUF5719 family protein [Microbacteriaceae bacterium]
MVLTDIDDDGFTPPSRAARAWSAVILTGRVTAGLIGLGTAAAVVGALTLLPLPSYSVPPLTQTVTPAASPEARACPGSLLSLASDFAASSIIVTSLGAAAVIDNSAITGLAPADLATPDVSGARAATAPSAYAQAAADARPLPAAAQSQSVADEFTAGFAAASCAAPAALSWLSAGSTATGRSSLLILANPTAVTAEVELTLFVGTGPLPAVAGISIAPGTQRVLSLASYAIDSPVLAVRVLSQGGRVQASLQQSVIRGLLPGGIDLAGATAPPALQQVIPGVVVRDSAGIAALAGDPSYGDAQPVVRLLAPGNEPAKVALDVRRLDGGAAAAALTVELEPGQVVDVPLPGLADGDYAIWVEADQPVIASARISTTGTVAVAPDFAWLAAAQPLPADAEIAIAPGPAPRLHLINPGDTDREVTLHSSTGGADTTLSVPAGSGLRVDVAAGAVVSIRGLAGGFAAVSFAGAGALAGYPAEPIGLAAPAVLVYL